MRHCIEVLCIEFDEGGHTLWVQGKNGTVLRLKTDGKITSRACDDKLSGSHADAQAKGDISICLGNDVPKGDKRDASSILNLRNTVWNIS